LATSPSSPSNGSHYSVSDQVLGEGASSKVLLGYDGSGRKVAIKCIPNLKGIKISERIQREVETLHYLQQQPGYAVSHCTQLLDVFEDEESILMVFEYKPGNLHEYIKKQRSLSEAVAKQICKQLVQAVRFLHTHGVAHRDIKIENILFDETTLEVTLCDFGFATSFASDAKSNDWCGSPYTVAPEILNRTTYSPAAVDIWALGSVCYTLMCGRFPFQAASPNETYRRTKAGRFHSFPSRISRTARDLISRCLIVDASKRIPLDHLRKHPFFWDDDDDDCSESDNESDCDESSAGEENEVFMGGDHSAASCGSELGNTCSA